MANKTPKKWSYASIQDTSKTLPRIEASKVEAALGGEPSDMTIAGIGSGSLSLFQVREVLLQLLQSTGGRPSLAGTCRRTKVPLSDRQWEDLEGIASEVASPGFSPSPGQIASVLITLSLHSIHRSDDADQDAAT